MTPAALTGLLEVIITKAGPLRQAGVRALSVGDVALSLEPHVDLSALKEAASATQRDEQRDPLRDPATYGLPDGARVPGFDFDDDPT